MRRAQRLGTADRNYNVAAFAAKARSALYGVEGEARPLHTIDAFLSAAQHKPAAARHWLAELDAITEAEIAMIMRNVPPERISDMAIEFATRLILINRNRLLKAGEDLR